MLDEFSTAIASLRVDVVLQKRALNSKWQSHEWFLEAVCPENEGEASESLNIQPAVLGIFRDELEGYYLNLTTDDPRIFVMLRKDDGDDCPNADGITLSYNEGARWMDAGERVESISMPAVMQRWLAEYVEQNYTPEPKKRRRPASFVSPDKRGV